MKLNHKIQIDLLEVFKTGKFEHVTIGRTKAWILNNFPDPDDHEAGATLASAKFWRYGTIDFFFEGEVLREIFSDHLHDLDGGEKLSLNKWILEAPHQLTVQYVVEKLTEERMDFWVKHITTEYMSQTSIGLIDSGIHLNFQPEEPDNIEDYEAWATTERKEIDPNTHVLCAFSLVEDVDTVIYKA